MGYLTPTDSKLASIHRMMIQGPPNSGKTSSVCETWPRPLHIVVAPGEKGDATIPRGVDGVFPYVWEEGPIDRLSSGKVVNEVEALINNILGGKFGPVATLCFDGFHKLYGYILDEKSGGQLFRGEELGGETKSGEKDQYSSARMYNRAREHARHIVQQANAAPCPNIVWLCWDGREADDPTKGFKSQTHVFPGLPGQAAKEFMGEFGLVVHSRINWGKRAVVAPKDAPEGVLATNVQRFEAKWQLLPEGDVWGACVKAPLAVIERLPSYCNQNYTTLKTILEDAWKSSGLVPGALDGKSST